jgi:hypothetical protein
MVNQAPPLTRDQRLHAEYAVLRLGGKIFWAERQIAEYERAAEAG